MSGPPPATPQRRSFIRDLRTVLASRDFRKLFASRLISQTGDGIFTAGLGNYVFFNATTYPNPAQGAAAFAVLYLPYSLIGPFAGVFIDRWSRRQILVWSAVLRALFVGLTASLVAAGNRSLPVYAAALLVLGVNRFFLSSLSAALPHVVPEDQLVMANGVSPTAGGIMAAVGGLAAFGVAALTGGHRVGSAILLVAAGVFYLLAGAAATRMQRDLLGPDRTDAREQIKAALAIVVSGLADGARYVLRRRQPSAALGVIGGNKFMYGILFLMAILLYRNYFYLGNVNAARSHFTALVVIPGTIGYACAALVTPQATARISKQAWIAVTVAFSGVVTGALGLTFAQVAFLVIAFGVNLASQSSAISAVTILQEQVEDDYRGRVFAFYDMMSNIPFVAGAALSAVFMPLSGKSAWLIGAVAAGYLLASAAYWAAAVRPVAEPSGGSIPSAEAQRSSS
jgi:MFS family permease